MVGAYPASAAHRQWNPEIESDFYSLLSSEERIGSLELPWLGSLHPHDENWLIANFPTRFGAIITDIPNVMKTLGTDQSYGIASPDPSGRARALADLKRLNDDVKNFNDKSNRKVVNVVEIHTAPRRVGKIDLLADSLSEISDWDWDGTRIAIEHCDAWVPRQEPEKGFLTLDEEIQAIELSQTPIELFINWGRSAIEFRDSMRVVEHIERASQSGRLSGIIFSGASAVPGNFGYAWIDGHHPFRKSERHIYGDPDSLLTEERVAEALQRAGSVTWIGVKLGWPNDLSGSNLQRYQMISAALEVLGESPLIPPDLQ